MCKRSGPASSHDQDLWDNYGLWKSCGDVRTAGYTSPVGPFSHLQKSTDRHALTETVKSTDYFLGTKKVFA